MQDFRSCVFFSDSALQSLGNLENSSELAEILVEQILIPGEYGWDNLNRLSDEIEVSYIDTNQQSLIRR
jgi:hypothetical protein